MVDAPSIDARGLDVPGLDAPAPDVPGLDAPPIDAPTPTERCAGVAGPPSFSGVTLARIDGVPIRDGFTPGWGVIEGPVWIGDALLISHFGGGPTPASRLYRIGAGAPSVAVASAGTNGLAMGPDGMLYGASHAVGGIVRFDPLHLDRPPETIVATYAGARFNTPNDLVVRSDGSIYFTDPDYQAPSPRPQPATRVYRMRPDRTVEVIAEDLNEPNGITLSLDERTLYVGSTGGLFRYPLDGTGAIAGGRDRVSAISGATDGMGRDCAGDLYVSNGGALVVLDEDEREIARLPLPSVTNVAFGGADGRTLYVTAIGDPPGLYSARLSVPGLPD